MDEEWEFIYSLVLSVKENYIDPLRLKLGDDELLQRFIDLTVQTLERHGFKVVDVVEWSDIYYGDKYTDIILEKYIITIRQANFEEFMVEERKIPIIKCIKCGRELQRPHIAEEIHKCSCGAKYYVLAGDEEDVVDSILDYFDLILPSELEHAEVHSNKIIVKHKGQELTAILLEEPSEEEDNPEEFGIGLWVVFIS